MIATGSTRGKVLRAARRAIALPAALGEPRRLAAARAEAVPRVPVEHAARAPKIARSSLGSWPMRAPGLALGVGRIRDRLGSGTAANSACPPRTPRNTSSASASLGDAAPGRPPPRRASAAAVELEQQRRRQPQRVEPAGIGAEMVGAVERLAGEGDPHPPARACACPRHRLGNSSVSG
jgi:hypothetical protein